MGSKTMSSAQLKPLKISKQSEAIFCITLDHVIKVNLTTSL